MRAQDLTFIVLDQEANEVGTVEVDAGSGFFHYIYKGEKSIHRFDSPLQAMGMLLRQAGVDR